MNITLFNKKYWIRRFGEQKIVRGYIAPTGKEDFVASLNVHPLSTDQQQALPEGERRVKRLEGHGNVELVVANQETGKKGDLLYYHGEWYECVNSQLWDHTILCHYNYQFTLVPKDGSNSTDVLNPPEGNPNEKPEGTAEYDVIRPASETQLGGVIVSPESGLTVDAEGYLSIAESAQESTPDSEGGGDTP